MISTMKKTLLALASALVLAGATASTASAQSAYYGSSERGDNTAYAQDQYDSRAYDLDRDGRPNAYDADDDNDGYADRYDDDDDNDGIRDRDDSNDGRVDRRYADSRYQDDRRGYANRDDGRRSDRFDGRHDNGRHQGWAKKRYHAGRYMAPRNYSYRQYQVGSRLPMGYYGSSYYVNYSPYGLAQPPRGYRWNRVGNDAYLVNTTNGIIRDVMYSLFY